MIMPPVPQGPGTRARSHQTDGARPDDRLLLTLEASTYTGSLALTRGATVLAERTAVMRGEREERLMPAVHALLLEAGVDVESVEGFVCGAGPGSFTSLRIAASIAKGLAVALEKPLFAVSSMLLVVAGAQPELAAGRYAVVLDAMRGESYAALAEIRSGGEATLLDPYVLLPGGRVAEWSEDAGALLVGPSLPAAHPPHARGVGRLMGSRAGRGALVPVDIDRWEPDYGRLAEAQVRWEAQHGRALPRG